METLRTSFRDHKDAWFYFLRGYKLQLDGRLDDAQAAYRRSISIYPTAEALTFLGWTLSHQDRFEEAIACCRRAIQQDPEYGNPYNDIGAYLLKLDRPFESLVWFERAIRARRYEAPHFPFANLGSAYEKLHQPDKARHYYRLALRIEPDHDFARQRLLRLISNLN